MHLTKEQWADFCGKFADLLTEFNIAFDHIEGFQNLPPKAPIIYDAQDNLIPVEEWVLTATKGVDQMNLDMILTFKETNENGSV